MSGLPIQEILVIRAVCLQVVMTSKQKDFGDTQLWYEENWVFHSKHNPNYVLQVMHNGHMGKIRFNMILFMENIAKSKGNH